MKLIYIYQSSFLLEGDHDILIFDFYRASPDIYTQLIEIIENTNKSIYVFVSHSHFDHYNEKIFEWNALNRNIVYILSDELSDKIDPKLKSQYSIVFLEKYTSYRKNDLTIKTYGSTDIGCSFFINLDEYSIFHAGDLNNWHWNEESTIEEINAAENYYQTELDIISKDIQHLNMLFFPTDKRLGKDYLKGLLQFLTVIRVDIVVPMHFGKNYLNYQEVKNQLSKITNSPKIVQIDKEGFCINL